MIKAALYKNNFNAIHCAQKLVTGLLVEIQVFVTTKRTHIG